MLISNVRMYFYIAKTIIYLFNDKLIVSFFLSSDTESINF